MIHSTWGIWAMIILGNIAIFLWFLRKGAKEAGRDDWIKACWAIRRELLKIFIPRWFKR